ncbi:tryptophanyl-tRNA synthetase [Stereum hirsutum FP-91666 SS1]|uniref:tryptophanyl-tRNA synthetase n=1 Tax=Stereum hirsutum (strain FP-91666) TaxID=721885 RepID=UPI0004449B97|nr:tryptophanyl-tRNA synthetase [Stereum hirsutum FP-91666 SS1]EIM82361.1 tryptophanyl-tRNA synthetase [Stereum hirsutum FP-91666 SS1]
MFTCSSTRRLAFSFAKPSNVSRTSKATISRKYSVDAQNNDIPAKRRPRIIFSGIQPTGIPHLGNYFGALANWVKLQREAEPEDELLFSVVGWHALTLPQDPKALVEARQDMMALMLAVGLDPKRSILFHQDHNQNHVELGWIFSCLTPVGKLRRMTTWKSRLAVSRNANDESEVDDSLLNTGLFTYPVLQAADILAYKATHVPVGDDQQQHLELARDIADIFNRTYKKPSRLFPLPQSMYTPTRRVLSLKDPSAKMSKSAQDPNSRILLTDPPSLISSKIRSAVTDSLPTITYDPQTRPGTSNLLNILAACMDQDVEDVVRERYEGKARNHADLKKEVEEAVVERFRGPREEFEKVRGERAYLEEVARKGAERAKEKSDVVLTEVRRRVGLA